MTSFGNRETLFIEAKAASAASATLAAQIRIRI
jgi:hypothetical protein